MTGRSPIRLLAPLALVAAAVALFVVVSSDSSTSSKDDTSPASSATPTSTPTREPKREEQPRQYTVKPGDTPSSIAAAEDVDLDDLLEANPDMDPNALAPGTELTIP